mgnify:FL=1
MATKNLQTVQLSIEVQSALDKDGNPTFKKKNFSGIKKGANLDNIYAVAEGIKGVLKAQTRDYYLTESSKVENN